MGVGCRLWRMPPSWFRNDWSEVAEVMAVGRWFQSLIVRVKELNMTGWLLCSWCRGCAHLVLGSACWQKLMKLMSTNPMLISTAAGVGCGAYCVQGCSISDCRAAIVRYQVSCFWSCCRRTLLLDDVPFQAPGRLFACRGPIQFRHTPV